MFTGSVVMFATLENVIATCKTVLPVAAIVIFVALLKTTNQPCRVCITNLSLFFSHIGVSRWLNSASQSPNILNLTRDPRTIACERVGSSKSLSSQNDTFLPPFVVPLFSVEGQGQLCRLPKNVLHVLLMFGRTLEVELRVHLLSGLLTLAPNTPRITLYDQCSHEVAFI